MNKITDEMRNATKDTMAIILAEMTKQGQKEIREWLNTVNTAEDFFGKNTQGLVEYNSFISSRENEYNRAVRKSMSRV